MCDIEENVVCMPPSTVIPSPDGAVFQPPLQQNLNTFEPNNDIGQAQQQIQQQQQFIPTYQTPAIMPSNDAPLGVYPAVPPLGETGFQQQPQQQLGGDSTFDCRGLIGYYPDVMLGCRVYYYCRGDGSRFQFRCPANLRYNASLGICDWPERVFCPSQLQRQPYLPTFYEPPLFDCRGNVGFLGDRERDFRVFYFCEASGRKHRFSCPSNLKFNEARGVCDWPDNILRGPYQGNNEFDCTNRPQGYYGSPINGIDNVAYYCPGTQPPPSPESYLAVMSQGPSVQNNKNSPPFGYPQTLYPPPLLPDPGLAQRGIVPAATQAPQKIVCPASLLYNPSIGACDWPENTASSIMLHQQTPFPTSSMLPPDANMLLHEQPPARLFSDNIPHENMRFGDADTAVSNQPKFGYTRAPAFSSAHASLRKGRVMLDVATATSETPVDPMPTSSTEVPPYMQGSHHQQSRVGMASHSRYSAAFDAANYFADNMTSVPDARMTSAAKKKSPLSVCKLLGHGFWADEMRNCSDYIYCRDDDREFRFSCPPRLKFNEKLGACDLSPNVRCKQRDYSRLSAPSAATITDNKNFEDGTNRLLRNNHNRGAGSLPAAARQLYRSSLQRGRRPGSQLVTATTTGANKTSSTHDHHADVSNFDCSGRTGLFADRHTECRQFYKCHEHGSSFMTFKCSRDALRFNERLQACEVKDNFDCLRA